MHALQASKPRRRQFVYPSKIIGCGIGFCFDPQAQMWAQNSNTPRVSAVFLDNLGAGGRSAITEKGPGDHIPM